MPVSDSPPTADISGRPAPTERVARPHVAHTDGNDPSPRLNVITWATIDVPSGHRHVAPLQAIEAKMSETSVTIHGVRSPLLEFGPPNASEAVVFVHGNPGSNRDWESLARGVGQFGCFVSQRRRWRSSRSHAYPRPSKRL